MKKEIENILKQFKKELKNVYGKRLKKIILYGSYARQSAHQNSDLDLLIVLKGKVVPGREIDKMIDIISEINLKYNVLISALPISEQDFLNLNSPLLLNVRREGISI